MKSNQSLKSQSHQGSRMLLSASAVQLALSLSIELGTSPLQQAPLSSIAKKSLFEGIMQVLEWKLEGQVDEGEFRLLYDEWMVSKGCTQQLMRSQQDVLVVEELVPVETVIDRLSQNISSSELCDKMMESLNNNLNMQLLEKYAPTLTLNKVQLLEEIYVLFDHTGVGNFTAYQSLFLYFVLIQSEMCSCPDNHLQFLLNFQVFLNEIGTYRGRISLRSFKMFFIRKPLLLGDEFISKLYYQSLSALGTQQHFPDALEIICAKLALSSATMSFLHEHLLPTCVEARVLDYIFIQKQQSFVERLAAKFENQSNFVNINLLQEESQGNQECRKIFSAFVDELRQYFSSLISDFLEQRIESNNTCLTTHEKENVAVFGQNSAENTHLDLGRQDQQFFEQAGVDADVIGQLYQDINSELAVTKCAAESNSSGNSRNSSVYYTLNPNDKSVAQNSSAYTVVTDALIETNSAIPKTKQQITVKRNKTPNERKSSQFQSQQQQQQQHQALPRSNASNQFFNRKESFQNISSNNKTTLKHQTQKPIQLQKKNATTDIQGKTMLLAGNQQPQNKVQKHQQSQVYEQVIGKVAAAKTKQYFDSQQPSPLSEYCSASQILRPTSPSPLSLYDPSSKIQHLVQQKDTSLLNHHRANTSIGNYQTAANNIFVSGGIRNQQKIVSHNNQKNSAQNTADRRRSISPTPSTSAQSSFFVAATTSGMPSSSVLSGISMRASQTSNNTLQPSQSLRKESHSVVAFSTDFEQAQLQPVARAPSRQARPAVTDQLELSQASVISQNRSQNSSMNIRGSINIPSRTNTTTTNSVAAAAAAARHTRAITMTPEASEVLHTQQSSQQVNATAVSKKQLKSYMNLRTQKSVEDLMKNELLNPKQENNAKSYVAAATKNIAPPQISLSGAAMLPGGMFAAGAGTKSPLKIVGSGGVCTPSFLHRRVERFEDVMQRFNSISIQPSPLKQSNSKQRFMKLR